MADSKADVPEANPDHDDFEEKYGPPLHELPEQLSRDFTDSECFITEYVNPSVPGFQAILKHRFSDFNVFEIFENQVVHLESLDIPEDEEKKVPDFEKGFPVHSDLDEEDKLLFTPITWTRLVHLAKKYQSQQKFSEADSVNVNVSGSDKEKRKRMHDLIKKYFPHLTSNTSGKIESNGEKKSLLTVCYQSKNTRAANEWPRDRPKYLQFTLYKEGMDQHQVLSLIGRNLRIKDKFGLCGTKDKRGRTTQKVTIPFVTPKRLTGALKKLRLTSVALGDFEYVKTGLELGQSDGNRFSVVLRDVKAEDDIIEKAVTAWREKGFVNYFGLQRFGTASVKTSAVGLALIQKRWQDAIELILMPRPNEKSFMARMRKYWWQYRDAKEALKIFGFRNENTVEGRLLTGLALHGKNDLVGALGLIQKNVRLMYLHAYQSHVFNQVLSERIRKYGLKVLPGDLKLSKAKKDSDVDDQEQPVGQKVEVVTESQVENTSILDIVMPLPGFNVVFPENEISEMYDVILQADNLTKSDFKSSVEFYSLGGQYRHIISKPTDVGWKSMRYSDPNENLVLSDLERVQGREDIKSEDDGEFKAVVIDFSLRSSEYATVALREVMKVDTGRDSQSQLTQSHLKAFEERKRKASEAEADNHAQSSKVPRTDKA